MKTKTKKPKDVNEAVRTVSLPRAPASRHGFPLPIFQRLRPRCDPFLKNPLRQFARSRLPVKIPFPANTPIRANSPAATRKEKQETHIQKHTYKNTRTPLYLLPREGHSNLYTCWDLKDEPRI